MSAYQTYRSAKSTRIATIPVNPRIQSLHPLAISLEVRDLVWVSIQVTITASMIRLLRITPLLRHPKDVCRNGDCSGLICAFRHLFLDRFKLKQAIPFLARQAFCVCRLPLYLTILCIKYPVRFCLPCAMSAVLCLTCQHSTFVRDLD